MNVMLSPLVTRRSALLGLTAAFTLGRTSLALGRRPHRQTLRGVPAARRARWPLRRAALRRPGFRRLCAVNWRCPSRAPPAAVLDLGGFYGLHPSLQTVHALYKSGDATILHAVARPLPQPQPFRGAGLPGMRRGPAHQQRLAEPRRRHHARRRHARYRAQHRPFRAADAARPRPRASLGARTFRPIARRRALWPPLAARQPRPADRPGFARSLAETRRSARQQPARWP